MRSEFIKRYLNKSSEEVKWSDLNNFILEGIEENLTLEYKPRGMLVDKNGKTLKPKNRYDISGFYQLAKLIAGFANSSGGLLVLGVKEKPEKHKGQIIKIRPGSFSEIPPTITREMIEHNLEAKIQVSIDEITIISVRKTQRSKNCVYLIDVPPSDRAPHRVNEMHYYQRHNFSTVEMQHYQIADMFGRRIKPDLEVALIDINLTINDPENMPRNKTINVSLNIKNEGRAVAKYVTCICRVEKGGDSITSKRDWFSHDDKKIIQYETKQDRVIYPDIPLGLSSLKIHKLLNQEETGNEAVVLKFWLYAEEMPGKWVELEIDPANKVITKLHKGGFSQ